VVKLHPVLLKSVITCLFVTSVVKPVLRLSAFFGLPSREAEAHEGMINVIDYPLHKLMVTTKDADLGRCKVR
jgi:hypothetical protein